MKSVTTILFVENDAVALTMYQKRLQREGFHVEIAEDGIAALKVLSEMTPDIVILDLMLPKFSGKDVFDYMRADKQFKKVPIIIFSNAPRTEWPQNPEASPTRALPKSEANFSTLLEMVRDMIANPPVVPESEPAVAQAVPAQAAAIAVAPTAPAPVISMESQTPPMAPHAENGASTPVENTVSADHISSSDTVAQFLEYATADMAVVREHCLAFIKGATTDAGRASLSTLRQRLGALGTGALKSNCARLAVLAKAWDALLAEIERKPSMISPSILQTLAQAADCLRILINSGSARSQEPVPVAKVLSVDDDEICNHVAVSALERSHMQADSVLDANAALELLTKRDYDMVLLDINMPGQTGFELCEKLRAMPHHQKTPVIFVTAFNNFENRKQSVLSGGGDLIAKPVSPLELALKVTIHLLKAPPKTVTAAQENAAPEPALVWKEPVETLSHDPAARRNILPENNGAPVTAAPTAATRAVQPESAKIELPKVAAPAIESPRPALSMQPEATKALAQALQPSAPIPAPQIEKPAPKKQKPAPKIDKPTTQATEPKPALESAAPSRPVPEKVVAVPTQPSPRSQPAAPISSGNSKPIKSMNKETNQQFETLVLDVAHIIFGENAPEINVRLVRMAMEQVWQNRANLQSVESMAREIARIIFGEASVSELNIRLVRMALEHSNSIALFKAA